MATWKADPEFMKRNESLMYSDQGFKRRQDAVTLIANLTGNLKMEDISTKEEKKFAPLLYNLAELQATCSKVLHISPDETLEIAHALLPGAPRFYLYISKIGPTWSGVRRP